MAQDVEADAGPDDDIDSGTIASFFSNAGGGALSTEGQQHAMKILQAYEDDQATGVKPEDQLIDKMKQNSENVKNALIEARKKLVARKYNPGEALLDASAAFVQPTKYGTIGERMGTIATALKDNVAGRAKFDEDRDNELLKMDSAIGTSGSDVTNAQMSLDRFNRNLRAQMAGKALTALKSTGSGSKGSALRTQKIQDVLVQLIPTGMSAFDAYSHAVNVVDGHEKIEVVPQLGVVRGTNVVDGTAWEVPLGKTGSSARSPTNLPGAPGQTPPGQPPPAGTPLAPRAGAPIVKDPLNNPSNDARDVRDPDRMTVWEATDKGTGFWSTIGAGWNAVGGNVGLPIADQVERSREAMKFGTQSMLRALSVNPDDPAAREIERIREEINILPSIAGNPAVMKTRLREIDSGLRDMYRRANADKDDTSLGLDIRKGREALASEIRNFLPHLGVPPEGGRAGETPVPLGAPENVSKMWRYMSPEGQELARKLYGPK